MTETVSIERRYLHLRGAADTASIRTASFMGREHVVVPVVALIGGAVVRPMGSKGPEYVPAEELSMVPGAWNGRPVVPDHPVSVDGSPVSAAHTPETLETNQFGLVHNTRYEAGRLKMDAYIDVERARTLDGDALSALTRAQAGQAVEVSVGAWVYADQESGVSPSGVAYEYVWREIVPDHLAMLPEGDIGACSVEMGCGAPRVAKSDKRKRSMSLKAAKEEIAKALLAIEPDADIKVACDKAGTVIYSMSDKHYQRTMGKGGLGEPVEVLAVVDYQPIGEGVSDIVYNTTGDGQTLSVDESMTTASTTCSCQRKDPHMAEDTTAVDRLIASSASPFTEDHRDQLKSFDSSMLKSFSSKYLSEDNEPAESEPVAAAPVPAEPSKEPAQASEPESKAASLPDWVKDMSAEDLEDMRAAGQAHKAEVAKRKTALVASLKTAQDAYSEKELQALSLEELRKVSRLCKVEEPAQDVDYSVRPLMRNDSDHDLYMNPPDPWALAVAKRDQPAGGTH